MVALDISRKVCLHNYYSEIVEGLADPTEQSSLLIRQGPASKSKKRKKKVKELRSI